MNRSRANVLNNDQSCCVMAVFHRCRVPPPSLYVRTHGRLLMGSSITFRQISDYIQWRAQFISIYFYFWYVNFKLPANLLIKIGSFSNLPPTRMQLFLVRQPFQLSGQLSVPS